MKHNLKSYVSLMLAMLLLVCNIPMQAYATENTNLPNATVEAVQPNPLLAGNYKVWNGSLSEGKTDLPLQVALNFKANDTLEEALAGGYADWLCDFYLTFDGMETNKVSGVGSYLAGYYGDFGWIAIPTDTVTVERGVEYPIVSQYDATLNYKDICKSVKDFTAALYINPETLAANPNMSVTLKLRMTNPDDKTDFVTIGDPFVYTAAELSGKKWPDATVESVQPNKLIAGSYSVWDGSLKDSTTDRPLQVALNFKANDTLEEAIAGGYSEWLCDFYLTFDGMETETVSGAGSYLAGYYGNFGWIAIPTDTVTVKRGVEYPIVSQYDATLNYKDICSSVKDFTAALYINPETLLANPNMSVTLKLKMTNPYNKNDSVIIGTPYIYTANDLLAANGYVARNTTTKKLYSDVNLANLEAADGETVILLADVKDVKILSVLETLDLNGHTLEAEYVTSFGHIVDNNDANAGMLKVPTNKFLLQSDNAQLPVHTAEGYQFVEVRGFNKAYLDTKQYVFQPLFEDYAHGLLLAGAETSGVNIQVNVSWKTQEGALRSQNFIYNDSFVKDYIRSYKPATKKYGQMFTLKLGETPMDLTYQAQVAFENKVSIKSDSTFVESTGGSTGGSTEEDTKDNTTTEKITINTNAGDNQASAVVSQGTKLEGSATADSLKLTVSELADSQGNITLGENEVQKSVDVHIEGISKDNTVPMLITVAEFAEKGLNEGNLKLYHVEKGETAQMTQVFALADVDAHNEFYYDPATGDITMALATFSEIALVADTTAAWGGKFDYSWYINAVAPIDGESTTEYAIANADQLAAFGAIVGGMNGQTQDSFAGKIVKLLADVNLGYGVEDHTYTIFYPIGYYNSTGSYEKTNGGSVTSSVSSFEGTFDGNGHTIANFYQNTWEMFGDYNDGYSGTPNHYKDAMGLFGYVVNGTVKNLTVDNFSSDGEFTPTGVIAAYAAGKDGKEAVFENIAITNCNPRVYNTGNGGIIGIAGNSNDKDTNILLKNITVDNTNKISALWGSWDVACGGLVGMFRGAGHAYMTNCHVAAQIDVFNDVCGNYQYYWYRYAGMMIGTNKNMITDKDGYTVPETSKFHAEGCTVHFGEWNDYYYCELVANSLASYTHDHQFSRLEQISSLDEIKSGNTWTKTGNFLLISGDTKTCYHIVNKNGVLTQHKHEDAGTETVNGETVLKENNQIIYLPFNQLFTGYGWGVKHIPVYNGENYAFEGITILDREVADSVEKFETKFTGDFLYRIGNQNAVKLDSLFKGKEGAKINNSGVWVTVEAIDEKMTVSGTYTADASDWTQGTIQFKNTGVVKVTIQDYNFCTPTVLYLEVVDATNATTAANATANNVVLLNNIGSGFTVSGNYTVYGNGFTLNYTGNGQYLNNGLTHGIVTVKENGTLDNLHIKASIYPRAYMYFNPTLQGDYVQNGPRSEETANDGTKKIRYHYQLSAVAASDNATISNCYIYGARTNIFVGVGNVKIKDSVLECGTVANVQIQSTNEYTVTLEDVTTIQYQVNPTIDDKTKVMLGTGVLVGPDGDTNPTIVLNGTFKQYNWVTKDDANAVSDDLAKSIINGAVDANAYNHTIKGKTASNLGIIYMNTADAEIKNNTGLPYIKGDVSISSASGQVYSLQKASSDQIYSDYANADRTTAQGDYIPTFTLDLGDQAISYDGSDDTRYMYGDKNGITALYQEGDSALTLDLSKIATIYKYTGLNYDIDSAICKNSSGSILSEPNGVVTLSSKGDYTLVFTVTDNIFYNINEEKELEKLNKSVARTFTVPLTLTVKEASIKNAEVTISPTALDGTYTLSGLDDYKLRINFLNAINVKDYSKIDTNGTKVTLSSNISSATLTPSGVDVFASASTITITYKDGRVLTVNLSKIDGNSPGTKTAKVNTSGDVYFITEGALNNKPTEASKQNKCTITSVSFKGNSGSTVTNDTDVTVTWELGSSSGGGGCVTPETLITLADGSRKMVKDLNGTEELLVWNLETGAYDKANIVFVDSDAESNYEIVHLYFADGSDVEVIYEHGFFDYDLGKYVYLDASNAKDYIGHKFVKQADIASNTWETVQLTNVVIENKRTMAYSPVTFEHLCYYTNGILSMPGGIEGLFNIFEVDTKTMAYDPYKMAQDIKKYGLFTYADFAGIIPEIAYEAFNGDILKVAIGKELIRWEDIEQLAERYVPLIPTEEE